MCFPLFWFRSIDFRMGFLGVAYPSFLSVGFLVGLWSLDTIHEYSKYWRPMIRQRCKSLLLPWIVFSLGCFSISGCSAIGPYFMRFCEKTIQCEKDKNGVMACTTICKEWKPIPWYHFDNIEHGKISRFLGQSRSVYDCFMDDLYTQWYLLHWWQIPGYFFGF